MTPSKSLTQFSDDYRQHEMQTDLNRTKLSMNFKQNVMTRPMDDNPHKITHFTLLAWGTGPVLNNRNITAAMQ